MDNRTFEKAREEFNRECERILGLKGTDYTIGHQEENKFYNFDKAADFLGLDSLTVATVYWLKHVFAICKYVQDRKEGSEPIEGRFADCRNYVDIMYGIAMRDKNDSSNDGDSGKGMEG